LTEKYLDQSCTDDVTLNPFKPWEILETPENLGSLENRGKPGHPGNRETRESLEIVKSWIASKPVTQTDRQNT